MSVERYAAADGVLLAARVSRTAVGPGGLGVLQLSGGPGCVNYLPDPPASLDALVATPDPRGVGTSEGGPHDLAQSLADLEALRAHLGVRRWVVIGHSSGADQGLAYAATYPDAIVQLVSVCGTGLQDDRSWHQAYLASADREPDLEIAFDADVHRALLDSWHAWVRAPRLLDLIRQVPDEVTVVAAEHDIRPVWPLEQLATLFRTPLRVLPGVGHNVWHERPDLWWDLVVEHVERHRHRPSPPTSAEDGARSRDARLEILDGLVRGLDDPRRLVDLLGACDDLDEARRVLGEELGLGEEQANAVLDLQLRRLPREERERIALERDELAAERSLAPEQIGAQLTAPLRDDEAAWLDANFE